MCKVREVNIARVLYDAYPDSPGRLSPPFNEKRTRSATVFPIGADPL